MKVAFLGLGVMGYPMAGHLAKAGHQVTVFNRTPAKAQAWVKEYGGAARTTPAQAAEGAEIVFTCVGNDNDIREVTTGPQGAFAGMRSGAILADHTTASADVARELAAIAQGKRLWLPRCAGLRRSGRRGQRQAHHHGRRRAGRPSSAPSR